MSHFGRVLTAMITPFSPDGRVNYEVAESLAIHLVNHGTDTLVLCGTTGESPTLTWDEEYELFKVIQAAVGDKAKIMAGTGSNSTREAIEATEKANGLGLDGTLQVVPYYNKPPQEGLYQHFQAIAQACPGLPMLLYNVPGRTSRNLEPETVARLSEQPNIVGIKEASGSLDQASHIRQLTDLMFSIYSGDDSLTLPLLSIGAEGVVSVASHLVGDHLQEMIQVYDQGRVKDATALHLKLFQLFKVLFMVPNPIPIKAALRLQGWDVGMTRLPLVEDDPEMSARLQSIMKTLGL
ncbi:MAG: 4-hydroxy-tetrahydrodipicolinate synthase [Cyanothece sp. SIO2G6]|nr:4-hydroxy-tetrahydrodipicolinate synthase [Cyanothece sp. SIO2G6]